MKTEVIQAWQVEQGDIITLGDDATYEIQYVNDVGETIEITVRDESGEADILSFGADDVIHYVVSFDDDEDVDLD